MVEEVRRQFREIPGIMEGTAKPEYDKCVAISTEASIREMVAPGLIALLVPVIVGFLFGPEVLGGTLAGVTVSGVLMGIFMNNAGGAWDNAKKSFEKGAVINGVTYYKKSEPHKAAVTGDTVGDPFKDTSGPSMNILIKLMSIVSLVIAPHIAVEGVVSEVRVVEEVTEMAPPPPPPRNATLDLNGIKLTIAGFGNPVEKSLLDFIKSDSKTDKETWFDFDRLLFETGSAKLKPESEDQLENVAEILKAYPEVNVKLGGYTDNTGDPVSNLKLSTDRASSVKKSLTDLGISKSRLESEGYGEEHAIASNDTEEGRAKNRRISIRVTKK